MENEFIEWLQTCLPKRDHLRLPVGDDAAVLDVEADHQLVVAADALLDGVHFDLSNHPARLVGRKALAVNLSDLAAMGARPLSATVTLALPRPANRAGEIAREVLSGVAALASEFDMSICGGDTNCWDQALTVSVTALGLVRTDRAWTRGGGAVGDRLIVSGPLGGSILGHHLSFTPRVVDSLIWSREFQVKAAIDVSDGLALDASRLAAASGCGIALQLDRVPISANARTQSRSTGRPALAHALGDGEDFELLLVMEPGEAARFCSENSQASDIGRLIEQVGLWNQENDDLRPLEPTGYQHE